MLLRMIEKGLRLQTGAAGAASTWRLDPHAGGHTTKGVLYQAVVVQKSSDNIELGLSLYHGPDGRNYVLHSNVIPTSTAVGSGVTLLSGNSDQDKMVGEWLRAELQITGTNSEEEWIVIDLYEMLKPF